MGKHVFLRNGLIAHLQGKGNNNPHYDNRKSTIPLFKFGIDDDEEYCSYLRNDFFGQRGLDNISKTIMDNLCTHFEEVFSNVGIHANTTEPTFTCGQYFPEKNQLRFTLIDIGEGFLHKIQIATNHIINDDKSAIYMGRFNSTTETFFAHLFKLLFPTILIRNLNYRYSLCLCLHKQTKFGFIHTFYPQYHLLNSL